MGKVYMLFDANGVPISCISSTRIYMKLHKGAGSCYAANWSEVRCQGVGKVAENGLKAISQHALLL